MEDIHVLFIISLSMMTGTGEIKHRDRECVCLLMCLERAERDGPRFLEIMLNRGRLDEGVEQETRQRLKRMLPLGDGADTIV